MRGISAHNLGVISLLAGRESEAFEYFEEAVEIKSQAFGKDHPEVAVSLDEIAIQYFASERYGEALVAFSESFDIICKYFGPVHPRTCILKNNIACCNLAMGNAEESLTCLKQALEIQQPTNTTSPPEQSDVDLLRMAIVLNNLGYVEIEVKRHEEAAADFEEALMVSSALVLCDGSTDCSSLLLFL